MTEHPGAETFAAEPHDPIPLLPRGTVILDGIPTRAVIMEELAPVIGEGTMVVRDRDRGAVVLVRDDAVFEVHVFEGLFLRPGAGRIQEVQSWTSALVTADRLEHPLVDLCATLLRGEVVYDDLRLSWITWPTLLADLGERGGTYVVEISTPAGRGVTCVAAGRQALSYTDIHPSLGDPALLEAMASNRQGSVRVRRVAAEAFDDAQRDATRTIAPAAGPSSAQSAGTPHAEPVQRVAEPQPRPAAQPQPAAQRQPAAQPQPAARSLTAGAAQGADHPQGASQHATNGSAGAEPGTGAARDWPATTWERPGPAAVVEVAPSQPLPQPEPAGDAALPDVAWVAPWEAGWREDSAASSADTSPAEAAPKKWTFDSDRPAPSSSSSLPVSDVIVDLRSIAQRRLQLSASRVEAVLEEGAQQHRSLDSVLQEIRGMSIRGVMPSTVEEMVDEMASAAEHRPG
jgi:hypothetical protein